MQKAAILFILSIVLLSSYVAAEGRIYPINIMFPTMGNFSNYNNYTVNITNNITFAANSSADMIKAVNQTNLVYGFKVLWENIIGIPSYVKDWTNDILNSTIIRNTNTSWINANLDFSLIQSQLNFSTNGSSCTNCTGSGLPDNVSANVPIHIRVEKSLGKVQWNYET